MSAWRGQGCRSRHQGWGAISGATRGLGDPQYHTCSMAEDTEAQERGGTGPKSHRECASQRPCPLYCTPTPLQPLLS